MIKKLLICVAVVAAQFAAYASVTDEAVATVSDVIPRPLTVVDGKGTFVLTPGASFAVKGDAPAGLADYVESLPLGLVPAGKGHKPDVVISVTGGTGEDYTLKITPRQVSITAAGEAGAFYGVQTLLQMTRYGAVKRLACCSVNDAPRFVYRGLHFDVSRHFRSKEFLMKQMDAMAMLKLNNLHLHFTDGAGWRMQIDCYPRLTEFAAWRPQRTWMDWRAEGSKYCEHTSPAASGGYYTKDDIREILAYARARHINVIPEIELPGHSEEVCAAYPELSCSGKPYVNSDLCVGKEATFEFLENVLSEVIDLFPSEYIHIGGDEAGKSAWKECPDCQRRMREEGLADVDELQSYMIARIERFVNSKGRRIIGWDEILDGGVAPDATVMSWRGTEGGIKAIKAGHDVIMTPGTYCYIDYSQDAPFREPMSIGGYTPLEKVYSYEPLEPGLTDADASHLLGLQANLWSEYVTEDSHAEHMYYPRAYAIAETGWTAPGLKDYASFRRRALAFNELLVARGFTPFDLAGEYGDRKESLTPVTHAACGADVSYNLPYSDKYPGAGNATLTDGLRGGWNNNDGRWQGTLDDFDVTVDLGQVRPVHYVGAAFMHSEGAWIHLPETVEISVSTDGREFASVATIWCDVDASYAKIMVKEYGSAVNAEARYVRLHAVKNPRPGAWLFTDEIIIN